MLSSPRIAPSPPSIPGYQVLGQLGRGGMGLVYEVLDVERGVRLALKAMHSFGGAADVLRFKAEFRALRDLHHPNLVTLGELLEHEGKFFLTMERVLGEDFVRYVRGDPSEQHDDTEVSRDTTWRAPRADPTLRDRIAALPDTTALPPPSEPVAPSFDEARLRASLRQLAAGLLALHDAGKVHRDVKPSNILVTSEGHVKLLDFGVVAELARDPEPDEVVGTIRYMAPEQALGVAPTPAADWYSVGVVLFQALTGKLPFEGGTTTRSLPASALCRRRARRRSRAGCRLTSFRCAKISSSSTPTGAPTEDWSSRRSRAGRARAPRHCRSPTRSRSSDASSSSSDCGTRWPGARRDEQ